MEVSRKDSWSELQDFYRGKRVLVTGHTGFKGSWLVRILMNMGADVTGYALNGPTDPCLFDVAGLEDHMDSVEGDVRDLAHLKEVFERVGRRWCFTWRHSRLCGIPIKIRSTPMRRM